mgnify:FL=1
MRHEDRIETVERKTSESNVTVTINLDGTGKSNIDTGVPFYDHMLTALSKHSLIDLDIKAEGDIEVDAHHTVEDVAITLGQAFVGALGTKAGIRRYGVGFAPLDESLARAVVDISGRPYAVITGEPEEQNWQIIGGHFPATLTKHVLESFASNADICLHVTLLYGRDPHHIVESQFKALALALREAVARDPRVEGIPSTKGQL